MAARMCPQCMKPVPAKLASAFAGLLAGWLAWRLTRDGSGLLSDVLPELYAVLAFGIVSCLVLMFTADLQLAPVPPPVSQAPAAGHGHGGAHH